MKHVKTKKGVRIARAAAGCNVKPRQAEQSDGREARQPTRSIGLSGAGWGERGARNAVGVAWGTPYDVGLQSLAMLCSTVGLYALLKRPGKPNRPAMAPRV